MKRDDYGERTDALLRVTFWLIGAAAVIDVLTLVRVITHHG